MHVNKYTIYICVNWIKYTILYTRNMTRIILQIYIEHTMHPTTVKIYVIMYVVKFKIYEWVFSGLVKNSSYWYLDVVGSNPNTVDIKFLSPARSPNLHSPFGKMSSDFSGREFTALSSVLKYWSMSFALELKPISDVLDTQTVHTNTNKAYF